MKILVLGANGATGKLVVDKLIKNEMYVKVVIRTTASIPKQVIESKFVEIVRGSILEFNRDTYEELIQDCDTVISCLGHNITLKGIFGNPRLLVSKAVQNICETIINKSDHKYKLILMNTTAHISTKESNLTSITEKAILSLLKLVLPPQRDNVLAANFLINTVGTNDSKIDWVIVRPDTLVNQSAETPYEVFKSPIRSPLFNPGKTSRINVGCFMVDLLLNRQLWEKWEYKMPVIYNRETN